MPARKTASFATEAAAGMLGRLSLQIARTIQSPGVAEVHDLRVSIRRFRGLLKLFRPCLPRHETSTLRRGLKRLMRLAGSVRDRDIALDRKSVV